jgi:hypothetical protein
MTRWHPFSWTYACVLLVGIWGVAILGMIGDEPSVFWRSLAAVEGPLMIAMAAAGLLHPEKMDGPIFRGTGDTLKEPEGKER